jgi:hypothetical protein
MCTRIVHDPRVNITGSVSRILGVVADSLNHLVLPFLPSEGRRDQTSD